MTCKDCIHSGLCYKENDYENFPNRCGNFIPERPQGEWVTGERNGEGYDYYCSRCMHITNEDINEINFCPKCGANMRKGGAEE